MMLFMAFLLAIVFAPWSKDTIKLKVVGGIVHSKSFSSLVGEHSDDFLARLQDLFLWKEDIPVMCASSSVGRKELPAMEPKL
jgi:hypothetical protein